MVKNGKAKPAELKRRLMEGIQVLTAEGILSGSGHLSVRIPGTETFLINPRYAGVLARSQDLCTVDFSGKRIAGKELLPLETAIHTAVYRSRPDVGSILHCHARYSVLVSLLETGLVPFDREASLFADGVPIFPESRGIRGEGLARAMVETLGSHYAIFLKGHGIVVVGPSIEGTCVSGLQLERACQDQLLLMSFTTPKPLDNFKDGRVAPKVENPYRAWPFLLHRHRIKSNQAIRATTKAMIQSLWPDDE